MKLRLLIVEDDRLLAEAVSDYFENKGWDTVTAYDGETALETAGEESFQMILLDVMLPGMDGFAVCRRLRETSDVPIFFITARVLEEDELNGYAAGADDYVAKPFSLPVLYARIMAMMHRMRGGAPAERLTKGGVEVDLRTKRVRVRGEVLTEMSGSSTTTSRSCGRRSAALPARSGPNENPDTGWRYPLKSLLAGSVPYAKRNAPAGAPLPAGAFLF